MRTPRSTTSDRPESGQRAAGDNPREREQEVRKPGPRTDRATSGPKPPRREREEVAPILSAGSAQEERFNALIEAIKRRVSKHNSKDLVRAVAHLSESLSKHRVTTVQRDYLGNELARSSYISHFLPWNVLRLTLAMRQTPFRRLPANDVAPKGQRPFVFEDWGSGPLTMVLALWVNDLLPKHWPTELHCVERNPQILDAGMALADELKILSGTACRIVPHKRVLAFDSDEELVASADIVTTIEAFNEWLPVRGRSSAPARAFLTRVQRVLQPHAELFVLEPASRVVSWGVMQLREEVVKSGKRVLAPCTHHGPCPLLEPRIKRWCHFKQTGRTTSTHDAFARALDMPKQALAWSLLHAQPTSSRPIEDDRKAARVLSQPFAVGENGQGVYACSHQGLILLSSESRNWSSKVCNLVLSGRDVVYQPPRKIRKDATSGAIVAHISECRERTQRIEHTSDV